MANPFTPTTTPTWTPWQSGSWRPSGAANGGYYNPQSYYGGSPTYWSSQTGQPSNFWAGLRYHYLNQNPDAVYTMYTAPFASSNTPYDNWVRQQFGETQDAYKAALSMNPDLTYQQFLTDFGEQGFQRRWQERAPSNRGVQKGPYGAGRVNWTAF